MPGGADLAAGSTVLILTPSGRDGELAGRVLREANLPVLPCRHLQELCEHLQNGQSVGAVLLTEEGLPGPEGLAAFTAWMRGQEPWSDLPVIVVTRAGAATDTHHRLLEALAPSGTVSILERPMRPATLVSALRVGLRARQRQFQVRDLLASQQAAAAKLEAARLAAEVASRSKDEFLAVLSHELRTPLNAILGWVHLLRMPDAKNSFEQALNVIERNALAQAQLIEDLLDVSQITSGKVRLAVRPINPAMLVRSAVDSVRLAAEARQIRLECQVAEFTGMVLGDPDRLQQVFWNLLSNAIKFTPRQGRVSVYIDVEASHVRFAVSDTGEGIAPEFLPHVFDRFSQADPSSTRNHKGLGLGLAIARHLIELHGGTVSVSSQGTGQGATFMVLLPCLSGSAFTQNDFPSENPPVLRELGVDQSIPPPPLRSDELAGVAVLAVEDHDDARAFLQQLLASKGATVVAAASVDEAFRSLNDCLPDVILCDIQMPGEDGYAFIRRLRARSAAEGGQIPAAALTAHARPEDRQRVVEAGFQLHVPKPIQSSSIIEVVNQLRHAHATHGSA